MSKKDRERVFPLAVVGGLKLQGDVRIIMYDHDQVRLTSFTTAGPGAFDYRLTTVRLSVSPPH